MLSLRLDQYELDAVITKVICHLEQQVIVAKASYDAAKAIMDEKLRQASLEGLDLDHGQGHPMMMPGLANEPEKFDLALRTYYAEACVSRWTISLKNLETRLGNAIQADRLTGQQKPVSVLCLHDLFSDYLEIESCRSDLDPDEDIDV